MAGHDAERQGQVWHGSIGEARFDGKRYGMARLTGRGWSWRGTACLGKARQGITRQVRLDAG